MAVDQSMPAVDAGGQLTPAINRCRRSMPAVN
jgi:hypothetical protein